tara:strand:- start:54 stop:638 length:585 start_codon:yes stop_codon:yes gene_type:complete
MKTLLTLCVLLFSSSVVADDISDFQIEGMSVGDSLLDYMTEEEIKNEIRVNRYMYNYLTDEFGEVYLFNEIKNYDYMSFFVKTDDKNYLIYGLRGVIKINNLEKCLEKQNKLLSDSKEVIPNSEPEIENIDHPVDPTGKSKIYSKFIYLNSGDFIRVACNMFEKKLAKKNNWNSGLTLFIGKEELEYWLRTHNQ